MTPSEAWALAPCEIVRWLAVRSEAKTEDGFELGRLIALGFNDPKRLAQDIREYVRAKRLSRAASRGGMEAVVEMFQSAGVQVIDRTKET